MRTLRCATPAFLDETCCGPRQFVTAVCHLRGRCRVFSISDLRTESRSRSITASVYRSQSFRRVMSQCVSQVVIGSGLKQMRPVPPVILLFIRLRNQHPLYKPISESSYVRPRPGPEVTNRERRDRTTKSAVRIGVGLRALKPGRSSARTDRWANDPINPTKRKVK